MEPLLCQWFRAWLAGRGQLGRWCGRDNSPIPPARFLARSLRRAGIASLALLGILAPAVPGSTADDIPRVRTVDPSVQSLIARGTELSPTLRALLAGIQRSDLIVYVERHNRFGTREAGSFKMAGCCGGQRYVRIAISSALTPREAIVTLAHELQHAAELASAAYVVDEGGMREFYCRIGDGSAERYDTAAARLVTRQVSEELSLRADR